MADLPSGTVTFLFTDIEGSARLAQAHPAVWEAARRRHHAILSAAAESHQGYVFQIIGGAFCVAFQNASDAIGASVSAKRALHAEDWGECPIRVRMGLHTGPAEARDGEYHGYMTLAQVQRVMSAADGGQTLLSNATAGLLSGQLPEGIMLRDMGEHRLKGVLNPEHLWQLLAPGLPADFPPLQSLNAIPNNLPLQLTSFIGRENEIAEIAHLLRTTRLLTLTGAGGCGKTRLALHVGAEVLDQFPAGVWFIELAPLADPALIPYTLAAALALREQPNRSMLDTLGDHFRARTALVVLDNCEHLVAGAARVCEALLHAAPHLSILATSRESLAIAGEHAYRVPSLAFPAGGEPLAVLAHAASVQLFVERAQAVKSDFALSGTNAPAIAQICRRLDGIPLAIELAAARVTALSVEQIAARLGDRFHLLTGGTRTALPRHQTLRASIEWSYNLLAEPERTLLRRLAVFAGGCSLEAAEAVCADESRTAVRSGKPALPQVEVLDLMAHLVDKSLVAMEESGGAGSVVRYRMLETIRQYARQKLDDSGESNAVRDRHLDFFMQLAEEAELKLEGAEQVTWLDRLALELDNLRAAIAWAVESHQAGAGLRLTGASLWFWLVRGSPSETCERIIELLALPEAAGMAAVRAKALSTAGHLRALMGQNAMARTLSEEALRLGEAEGEQRTVALAFENLGLVTCDEGDDEGARLWFERSAQIRRALGDKFNLGTILAVLGELAFRKGQNARAQALLDESLSMLRAVEEKFVLAIPLRLLSRLAMHQGDYRRAMLLGMESLQCNLEIKDRYGAAASLAGVAAVLVAQGKTIQAVRLFGAVDALLASIHTPLYPIDRAEHDQNLATLRAQLDAAAFAEAWAAGRALTIEQAFAETERIAAESQVLDSKLQTPAALFAGLTPRERDVLRWLARGLTDAEIAETLVISRRTVNSHLRSIYDKLDVTSRTAAARAALDLKLV